jgi:hypothetical protein
MGSLNFKKITPLNLSAQDVQDAKKKGINISEVAGDALKEALGKTEIQIDQTVRNCEFCGIEGERETREDIEREGHYSKPNKLTWLWPDEKWICNRCLRRISDKEAANMTGYRR